MCIYFNQEVQSSQCYGHRRIYQIDLNTTYLFTISTILGRKKGIFSDAKLNVLIEF